MRLYVMFGIPEYWLINLNHEILEVYRHPLEENYQQKFTLYYGEKLNLSQIEGISVSTADILN